MDFKISTWKKKKNFNPHKENEKANKTTTNNKNKQSFFAQNNVFIATAQKKAFKKHFKIMFQIILLNHQCLHILINALCHQFNVIYHYLI